MRGHLDLIALEVRLMETLHDLTGYTFDRLGAEAIKHAIAEAHRTGLEDAAKIARRYLVEPHSPDEIPEAILKGGEGTAMNHPKLEALAIFVFVFGIIAAIWSCGMRHP